MSICRVNKNKDYTIMGNHHLKNKNLSLKTVGLLSKILSLPDDWNYTVEGLTCLCKENETAIKSSLKELKENGYLVVNKIKPCIENGGRWTYEYDFYEQPKEILDLENLHLENLDVESLDVENLPLYKELNKLNTKELNTNKLNTDVLKQKPKPEKHKYGEYGKVLLTDKQYEELTSLYGYELDAMIKILDDYCESNGKTYKNYLAVLKSWVRERYEKDIILNSKQYTRYQKPKEKTFEEIWADA